MRSSRELTGSLFFEYVNAAQDLLTQVMRPELKQMVLWRSDSDEQTPFVEANPYYEHPELDHADQLSAEARDDFETANDEQNAGDRFIMVGVTFIAALGLLLTGL